MTLNLDQRAAQPLYQQLYNFIKGEIQSGSYPFNTKLPSKRQLSEHLQCSHNTVQNAYSQLIAEGYIRSKPKSGFYVCGLDGLVSIDRRPSDSTEKKETKPVFRYEFSHHGVDSESFPFSTWRKITREVIHEYDPDLLKLGDSQGDLDLRISIVRYLNQSRAVKCSPEQVVISAGTEFLLQLLIQLFEDDCIYALENPGYEKMNLIFKSSRAQYKTIPLDENGLLPDALSKSRAEVVCVTPSHQFPLGNIMPISRRIQLLNWANEDRRRYIIEDDYDSEFKYSGKPIPSLQGLDCGEKIIYLGAFSKSLTPALRVSYMVLPQKLLEIYREKLTFYICPVPTIQQKVLHRFMNEGHFERHLNKMRNIYKKKREALTDAIGKQLPGVKIGGANVGLHLILEVQNGMEENRLVSLAQEHGVKVYGLSQYYIGGAVPRATDGVLLGFATIKLDEISRAVELLRRAWFK